MAEEDRGAEEATAKPTDPQEEPEATQKDNEPDFSKKHPLECKWVLWFDNPNGKQQQTTWGQTLRAVYEFETVEDFWCLYNNIKPPSWLPPQTDYYLFKKDIEPKWEDPKCEHGGSWKVMVPKGPNSKQLVDTMWLNTILACIGEQFTEGDEICGAVVNVRAKQDRVSMWTKTASNEAAQISIGKQVKQLLDLGDSVKIGYTTHADAKNDNQRRAKDRYTT